MVQRPGGDSVSAKGWWMLSYMPCSQLWAGRTQTIRWVGWMGTSLPSKFSEPKGHRERPRVAQMRTGCNCLDQGTQSLTWHRVAPGSSPHLRLTVPLVLTSYGFTQGSGKLSSPLVQCSCSTRPPLPTVSRELRVHHAEPILPRAQGSSRG